MSPLSPHNVIFSELKKNSLKDFFVLKEMVSTTHQKNGLTPKKYTIAKLIKLPSPPYCNILTNKKI